MPFRRYINKKEVECKKCGQPIKVGEDIFTRYVGSMRLKGTIFLGNYCKACAAQMGAW